LVLERSHHCSLQEEAGKESKLKIQIIFSLYG
jgi:hypothetical protein